MRARRAALVLSAMAVGFSLGFGVLLRKFLVMKDDAAIFWLMGALALLLVALLLRIFASLCELVWLERTWTNLPEELRRVGPMHNVSSVMLFGLSFIPVFAWFWKLGLIHGVASGFEKMREQLPFKAVVPRKLGIAAVIFGWIPGLNVYIAPFLWEMFARRIDAICHEMGVTSS